MQRKRILLLTAALLAVLSLAACRKSVNTDRIGSEASASEPATAEPVTSSEPAAESVQAVSSEPVVIHVDGIKLSAYEKTITEGERFMPIVTMSPQNATDKGEKWETSDASVAIVNNYGNITAKKEGSCTVTVTSTDNPEVKAEFKVTVKAPEKVELTYMDGILIANKTYPLPSNYNPGENKEARAALNKMFAESGLKMWVCSGFRSYNVQKNLYNSYVRRDGAAKADTYSARPGYSEHQTGLAFDINYADSRFNGTEQAKWLAANAHKYGFILRYPEGKEQITGYMYEPWHYRYVGVENAEKIYASGLTLEEYFGITSVYQ